ncbi:hypothetical protein DRN98_06585 [Methanosarcinales archaeon]|nr:MAG: hypothetical protein DRN98_06585 [Methanosarcinales archaeon]
MVKLAMKNAKKLLLLWIVLAIPIVGLGGAIGWITGFFLHALIVMLVFVLLLATLFYLYSDRILLRWYHAEKVVDATSPLYEIVDKLAKEAEIPVPDVYIVDTAMPNAFVVGRNFQHASLVVTTGLMELLESDEMEAVLADMIVHIKEGDILTETEIGALAGILTALPVVAFWCSIFTGFGQEDDPAPNLIKFFVTSLFAPIAAMIVQFGIAGSRQKYSGNAPEKKIKEKLTSEEFYVNPSHAHLLIVSPPYQDNQVILDLNLPTYHSLFQRVKREKFNLRRHLFFSSLSYLFVLFMIIVIYTFSRKDFDFLHSVAISAVYLSAVLIFYAIMLKIFRTNARTA